MAKTNKLRKPAVGLHSDQPSAKAATAKIGATARQPGEHQPNANTKKQRKAEIVTIGQSSGQSLTATEPTKTAETLQQPVTKLAIQQPDATSSDKATFGDFISTLDGTPSTKNDAPTSTASRPEGKQPTTDTAVENPAKKTALFAGLFSTNRRLIEENELSKFAVDDGPLTLEPNDMLDVRSKLSFCLIGYIAGKFPGLKAIRALSQSWGSSFQQHESGWLIFHFAREEDRQRILSEGLYFIYGRLLLKHVPDCFEFKEDDISLTPVWATLPSLPLECWHPNALGKIGSRIGNPIAMDSLTMKMESVSYARILETCQGTHTLAVAAAAAPATAPVKQAEANKSQTIEWTTVQRRKKGKSTDIEAKPAVEDHQPISPAIKVDKGRISTNRMHSLKLQDREATIPTDSDSSSTDSPTTTQHIMLGIKTNETAMMFTFKIQTFLSRSFPEWCQANNFDTIAGGRILVIWNPTVIDLQSEDISRQVIHCRATNKSSQLSFYISFTYGLYSVVNRRSMWEKLTELGQTISIPWLIMGDFNCVKSPEEKQLGVAPTWYEHKDFVDCLTSPQRVAITHGIPTMKATLCGANLTGSFTTTNDLRPVYIAASTSTHRDAYPTTPRQRWNLNVEGTPQFSLCKRLKALKGALKAFNTQHYNHISTSGKETDLALQDVQDAQNQLESNLRNVTLRESLGDLRRKAVFLVETERHFFYQKTKIHYLKQEDQNTKFSTIW
ncbi:UNVERIFIED_CONTAM: hypothetical protein Sindi_0950300 [Sesamum indicum]